MYFHLTTLENQLIYLFLIKLLGANNKSSSKVVEEPRANTRFLNQS